MPNPETDTGPADTAGLREDSLIQGVRALLEDGQLLVEAELAFQKARLGYCLHRARGIGTLVLLGLAFAFFFLVALVVGLLLALAPLLTPWGALAVVGLALLGATAFCLMRAVAKFRAAKAALFPPAEPGA